MSPRAAVAAVLGVLALVAVPTSAGASYGVRSATAVLAAVLLLRMSTAIGRASRALLAVALLMGIASGLVATVHLLVTGEPSPTGAAADWTYLSYGPLAVAGLLVLPRHPQDGPWRAKALTEAAIVVSSLGFVLSDLMGVLIRGSGQDAVARAAALGYPLNAVFVLTVLLVTVPRLPQQLRPFLRLCAVGFSLLTLSDLGYSVGALHGWYTPTTWPAVVQQLGLLTMAAAPLAARQRWSWWRTPRRRRASSRAPRRTSPSCRGWRTAAG